MGSSSNNYLASVPISRQIEIRQEVPVINASQPNTSSIFMQGPKTIPSLLQKERINTLTYIYLSLRIIELVTSFIGIWIVCQWIINPMILVELTGLAYRYGPTIYAIDRVNGTMYGRFSRGFRMISERATIELQYKDAPLVGIHGPAQPMCMSTLSGTTQMVTPLAKSTPVTQSSQVPLIVPDRMPPVRDVQEPTSNEQARADYLER